MPRLGRALPIRAHTLVEPVTRVALPFHFYNSTFPATENPISESGVWSRGLADGRSWTDPRTTTNKTFGTESGNSGGSAQYDDSIGALKGIFGTNQQAEAVVFNTATTGLTSNQELELLVRFTITPGLARGYEFTYEVTGKYIGLVRWNGALGGFNEFAHIDVVTALSTGDVLRLTAIGNVLTGYRNGVAVISASDPDGSPYTDGNPGMGFFLKNITDTGDITKYGFSQYTARTLDVRDWRQVIRRQAVKRAAIY